VTPAAFALIAAVPVQPDRQQGHAWAVEELSRPEYQAAKPGLVARILGWIWRQFGSLDFGSGASSLLGFAIFALLVGAVVAYILYRTGGLHRTAHRANAKVFTDPFTSAAEHRAAADRHAAAAEWDLAVVERFRAIARELEERALLSPQPGRTAVEVATDGGHALPELAAGLRAAARSFDDVSYGHLSVGPSADRTLRELDNQLRSTKPVPVS
jgi:Domain of unknown function (DUF4129)